MGIAVGGDDDGYNTTINVVPLVDIMLVMIIIFIITLPVMTHAVKIDLPRATNQPPPDVVIPPVNIEVKYNGEVVWDGTVVSPTDLRSYIAAAAGKPVAEQPDVHIQIDRRARYDDAAKVLFAVQRGGLKKIGFVADENGGL
jgi:biopolymer transport protein ExbD